MQIHGLNKTTLLDYPGFVASTIFTGACNFRCPFCQNADLVLNPTSQPIITEEEIFAHLEKRKGIVKGVCITGGEPTLQADLCEFVREIKDRGFLVKLDTNGYKPEILKYLIDNCLVDYVAMDIKSSISRYAEAAGVKVDVSNIIESVSILKDSHMDYEFRTTVTRELHDEDTFEEIGDLICGAKNYYLQNYVDSERVINRIFTSYTLAELERIKEKLEKKVRNVAIRGLS